MPATRRCIAAWNGFGSSALNRSEKVSWLAIPCSGRKKARKNASLDCPRTPCRCIPRRHTWSTVARSAVSRTGHGGWRCNAADPQHLQIQAKILPWWRSFISRHRHLVNPIGQQFKQFSQERFPCGTTEPTNSRQPVLRKTSRRHASFQPARPRNSFRRSTNDRLRRNHLAPFAERRRSRDHVLFASRHGLRTWWRNWPSEVCIHCPVSIDGHEWCTGKTVPGML